MTALEICTMLHFDKAHISYNPYYFENDYEEKGVLVLMKLEKGSDLEYLDIDDICFQCPTMEHHPDLVRMVLFLFDGDHTIYNYSIASSKHKVLRSEILNYEKMIGTIITRGEENA